jgi:hypothetical protein
LQGRIWYRVGHPVLTVPTICGLKRGGLKCKTKCQVDDILCVSLEPQVVLNYLPSFKYSKVTNGRVKEPDKDLGTGMKKWATDSESNPSKVRCWAMLSNRCVNGLYLRLNVNSMSVASD